MSLRFQWKRSPDGFQLLLEPYLGIVQKWLGTATVYPKLYFCYNAMTQQTTILTTDLNRSHLWMIQHLKGLSGMHIRPEEVGRLLIQHFVMVQECFTATAVVWDERANGPVCCKRLHLHLCLHPIPNSNWHQKRWTAARTIMRVFVLLNWMPDLQI